MRSSWERLTAALHKLRERNIVNRRNKPESLSHSETENAEKRLQDLLESARNSFAHQDYLKRRNAALKGRRA